MMFVSVCANSGKTDVIFVDKINGAYYLDMLLTEQLLTVMSEISGEFFIFQQDS